MKFRRVLLFLAILLVSISGQAAPIITSFWPMVGASNDTDYVTITGSGFYPGTLVVKFNGVTDPTAFATLTDGTQIQAHVAPGTPLGMGRISVTVNGAMTQSGSFFTVIGPDQPYVTNFVPIIGGAGAPVVVQGVHFFNGSVAKQVSAVRFNGVNGNNLFVASDNQVNVNAPNGVSTGPLVVVTPQGSFSTLSNTISPATNFFVPPAITSFSPSNGRSGTNVVITGSNFLYTTSVMFGSLPASFTTPTNNTTLRVVVPVGAATGKITVNTPANNPFTTSSNFVVQPTVYSFSPPAGNIGTSVTVFGANFNVGTPTVKFGGVTAATPTGVSFGQLTAVVPGGASNAPITVTTTDGSSTSTNLFYLPPVITSITPTNSAPGTSVTIGGQNLLGTTAVSFNGTAATFTPPANNTSLQATVPSGFITGPISVTTPGGIATSSQLFYGAPIVNSFNPTQGLPDTNVTIIGTNFLGTSGVKFNGVSAMFVTVVNNGQINTVVPGAASTGPITVVGSAGNFTTTASFTINASNLGVGISDLPDPVFVGSNLVYSITIMNNGPSDAPNVRVTNTLPASVTLVSAVTTQGTLNTNANPILGSLGTINNGSSATITLSVVPQSTGSITNVASAASDFIDLNTINNHSQSVTTVWPLPALSIVPLISQVQVLWPAPLSNFTLQYVPGLGTSFGWSNLGIAPVISGTNSVVTDSSTNGARFYRLKE